MLLPKRSILSEIYFVTVLVVSNAQHYEGDYESEVDDHDPRPDYSKFYSANPPSTAGLVGPIEFSSFFPSSIEFGESSKKEVSKPKNPFAKDEKKDSIGFANLMVEFPEFYGSSSIAKDFFEESQKRQNIEKELEKDYSIPGPEDYSSDAEKIPKNNKKKKNNKKSKDAKKDYDYDGEDYKEPQATSGKAKTPDYSYDFKPSTPNFGKQANYNVGKSSSTVSQYPKAAGVYQKLSAVPTTGPFQKYAFKPVGGYSNYNPKYLESILSTAAPFNPAYSKLTATQLPSFELGSSSHIPFIGSESKNCRKVVKPVTAEENMNCYVCENAETKSKYTECAYSLESEPTNIFKGKSERYSTPSKGPDGFRYKRYTTADDYTDPYEFVKARSQREYEAAEKDHEDDYSADYTIPEYYTEYEKSSSEAHAEELAKTPGNCQKIAKDGMTCTICKDPKNGGNYEQCSYTIEPNEKKYAYSTQKKYDSLNDPNEEGSESKPSEKTADKDDVKSTVEPIEGHPKKKSKEFEDLENYDERRKAVRKAEEKKKRAENSRRHEETRPTEPTYYHRYRDRAQPSESRKKEIRPNQKKRNQDHNRYYDDSHYYPDSSNKYETKSEEESDEVSPYKEVEEYNFKLFPEYAYEETRNQEEAVEDVLAEFVRKDRSSCEKSNKNGMTCYLCVDQKGIKNEECMYVSESNPKPTKVAYQEVKELNISNKSVLPTPQSSNKTIEIVTTTAITPDKRKRQLKKVPPTFATLEAAASEEHFSRVKYPVKRHNRKYRKAKELKAAASTDDESTDEDAKEEEEEAQSEEEGEEEHKGPETPKEFIVGEKEGAYSEETKPVYSKLLGVKLPKYMVEKSDFEKEFDEFAKN